MYMYRKLDYDYVTDHKYEFSVFATDRGSPPLTASALVQVTPLFFAYFFLSLFTKIFSKIRNLPKIIVVYVN